MTPHPNGCMCGTCIQQRASNQAAPQLPYAAVYYAAGFPDTWYPAPATITFTPTAASVELQEIRKLREEVRELAKTQAGMAKLVERFLKKAKK